MTEQECKEHRFYDIYGKKISNCLHCGINIKHIKMQQEIHQLLDHAYRFITPPDETTQKIVDLVRERYV
jgi:hypothetical protein